MLRRKRGRREVAVIEPCEGSRCQSCECSIDAVSKYILALLLPAYSCSASDAGGSIFLVEGEKEEGRSINMLVYHDGPTPFPFLCVRLPGLCSSLCSYCSSRVRS
jgi:hypothetical protein